MPERTGMRRLRVALIVVALIGVLLGLVTLWWWALFGMTKDVGLASGITALSLALGGFGAATYPAGHE